MGSYMLHRGIIVTLYRAIKQLDEAWVTAKEHTKELREREFWKTLVRLARSGMPESGPIYPNTSIHVVKAKHITIHVPLNDQWVKFQLDDVTCKCLDKRYPWAPSLTKYGFSMTSFYIQIYMVLEGYNPLSPRPRVELPVYIRDCKYELYLDHCHYIRDVTSRDEMHTYTIFKQFHHLWKTRKAFSLYTSALNRIGIILEEIVMTMNIEDGDEAASVLRQLVNAYENSKELLGIDRSFQLNKRVLKILEGSDVNVIQMWEFIFGITNKHVELRLWPYLITVIDIITKWLSGIFPIITKVVQPNGHVFIPMDWLPAPENSQVMYHKLYPILSIRLSRNQSGKISKSKVYKRGDIGIRYIDPDDPFYTGIIPRN